MHKKTFVITGAASGIGFEIAKNLISEAAEVVLVGRRKEALEEAVKELGDAAHFVACDVSDEAAVDALGVEVETRWPHLDGLVNNAGIAIMATLEDTSTAQWDEVFAINVRGPYLVTRRLLTMLRKAASGSVVNISSTLAEKAIPGMAAYNASKAALNQLTKSVALELAPQIRVNAVMPAVVDTPIHSGRGMTPEQVQRMGVMHPLGRVGTPDEVADLVVFLLSERAKWMTGAIIPIDGGMMAG